MNIVKRLVGSVLLALFAAGCGDDAGATTDISTTDMSTTTLSPTTSPAAPSSVPPAPSSGYVERDVRFTGGGSFELAGTISVPVGDGPFPGVVLVTGSGPQDRNETIGSLRPFEVLSRGLVERGVAVLRYDDRGVAESGGEFFGATTDDLAWDAAAAVAFLSRQPEVEGRPVGLVGHSEGGVVAPLATQRSEAAFVVMLAGSGAPGAVVLATQSVDIAVAEGVPDAEIEWQVMWLGAAIELAIGELGDDELRSELEDLIEIAVAASPQPLSEADARLLRDTIVETFADPWMRFFLAYDPVPVMMDLDVPVLALLGELDLQVSPDTNLVPLEMALADNPDGRVEVLPGMNHLFQTAETGALSAYQSSGDPMDAPVPEMVAGWILDRFG